MSKELSQLYKELTGNTANIKSVGTDDSGAIVGLIDDKNGFVMLTEKELVELEKGLKSIGKTK